MMRDTQRLRQRLGAGEVRHGICLLCAILLAAGAAGIFAGGSNAYPCVTRDTAKSERAGRERPCRPPRRAPQKHRHSSVGEFAFAGGLFLALLLLPVVPKNLSLWDDDGRERRSRY